MLRLATRLLGYLRPRRRWFQYSLRTLLLATTLLAAWLGWHVHRVKVQKESVAAIQRYGGWVRYDFQFPSGDYAPGSFDPKAESPVPRWLQDCAGVDFFHSVVQVNLNYSNDSGQREENDNPSDEALQYLTGLPKLRGLLLSDTQATDASMQYLAGLKRLEYLFMWDVVEVGDAGVEHLKDLRRLKCVHLSNSQITDRSLEVFADMPHLTGLCLQFNNFTDEGMKHVCRLRELESLIVCGRGPERAAAEPMDSPITDKGLRYLERLTKLKKLGIQYTDTTPEGVRSFREAVPGCLTIYR